MDNDLQHIKLHAKSLYEQSKFQDAIKQYSKLLHHEQYKNVDDDDLSIDALLLKQKTYLMRGRCYVHLDETEKAKQDFDQCIEIFQTTKSAYMAMLFRARLKIETVEHLNIAKTDLESIINVCKIATKHNNSHKTKCEKKNKTKSEHFVVVIVIIIQKTPGT